MDNNSSNLEQGEFFRLGRTSHAVRCLSGSLWITFSGENRDFLLVPGSFFELRGKKNVCIQAMEKACVECRGPRAVDTDSLIC